MHRLKTILGGVTLAFAFAACGGGYSGFIIPVESPLNPWVAPTEDELANDDGIGAADEGEYEDYEDYEDEEGDEDEASTPAPPEAKAPSAKPAPK